MISVKGWQCGGSAELFCESRGFRRNFSKSFFASPLLMLVGGLIATRLVKQPLTKDTLACLFEEERSEVRKSR